MRRSLACAGIPVREVVETDVVNLDPERTLLTNLLKMAAYQAESDLVHRVVLHYKRTADEGRTLIHAAPASPADLEVTVEELRVLIAPSVHRIARGRSRHCAQI